MSPDWCLVRERATREAHGQALYPVRSGSEIKHGLTLLDVLNYCLLLWAYIRRSAELRVEKRLCVISIAGFRDELLGVDAGAASIRLICTRFWLSHAMSIRGLRLDLVPASPADAPAMQALVRAAYERYVPQIGREPAPMTADYHSVARSGRALLGKIGSELAGLVVTEVENDALLVENLAVLPRLQGSGVGSLLLRKAEDLAREAGLSEVRLFTNEAMTENITFYHRKGFAETDRSEQDGYRRVFLVKPVLGAGKHSAPFP